MKAMFTKNTLLLSAIIAATLGLAGCNDSSSSSSTQSGEGDISLNVEESWEAEKNVTYDVVATNDGDPGKINWSVSDESILEISSIEQGGAVVRVKALDYGTATIKASIDNGNAIESEVKVEGLSQNVFAVEASQANGSMEDGSFANFSFTMPHNSGVLNAKIAFEVDSSSIDTGSAVVSGNGLFEVYEVDGQQITWTGTSEDGNQQGYVILYAYSDEPDALFYGVPAEEKLTLGEVSFKLADSSSAEEVSLKINKVQVAGVNELLNIHQYEPSIVTQTASVTLN